MLIYWLWLATRVNLSEQEKLAVLAYFENPEDCYYADAEDFSRVEGLRLESVKALCDKDLTEAEEILETCAKKKIHLLAWADKRYPSALRNIADPPLLLYYRGVLPEFDREPLIGVVGTRKASVYGMRTAQQLGKELAHHGGIVVSGMAEGIDTAAIQGALQAGKPAVGVLGCGVDYIYPWCNRDLFAAIEGQGCLLSEYPPGTKPYKWNFPRRNRIISGLSCGVLVVEAPRKSGALITAQQALEQGRDVYVVPGNIGVDSCAGSNALLRDGAVVVTCGMDILREYICRYPDRIREKLEPYPVADDKKAVDNLAVSPYSDVGHAADDLDETEQAILAALGNRHQLIDTIIAETGLSSGAVLAALTMLEVKGYVSTQPGGWVIPGQNQ